MSTRFWVQQCSMSDMVSMSSTMRCDLEKPARLKVAYSFRIHKPTRPTYLPENPKTRNGTLRAFVHS